MSDASRLRRLQRLTAAVRNHVGSNTAPFWHSSDADIAAIEKGQHPASGLAKLAGGTTAWPSWEASTAYAVDEVAEPVVRNGYRYAVTTAGTTAGTEPTWGTTVDGTTNDGTASWTNIRLAAFGMWDAVFDQWNNEAAMLAGLDPTTRHRRGRRSRKVWWVGCWFQAHVMDACISRSSRDG